MARAKEKIVKDTAERWLLTYSDLMNLLLIFFIILYAISQVDQQKFEQLASSFSQVLGTSNSSSPVEGSTGSANSLIPLESTAAGTNVIPTNTEEQQMKAVESKVTEIIQKEGFKGDVEVKTEERGIVISIHSKVLFKPGSANIEEASKETVRKIGKALLVIPGNQIRIEGHTDSDPIRTSNYPSNWELSSARATNVLRFLVEQCGVKPQIISSVGYGEWRKIVENDSEQNKAKNRRVNIVIVRSGYDKAEAQPETTPTAPAVTVDPENQSNSETEEH